MEEVLPTAQSPSTLPQKSKDHDHQFRLKVLRWMALTPEDLDNSDNGVVMKQGVTITLTLREVVGIYFGRRISKDTSNESPGDQTPAYYEVRIRKLERELKAAVKDRQLMMEKHIEIVERVERDQNQMLERLRAMTEEKEAIMEKVEIISLELKKLEKAEMDHQCKREKTDA
ncbi:hypothetical protein V8C34DRAFT_301787 [Trichoderma compactum]